MVRVLNIRAEYQHTSPTHDLEGAVFKTKSSFVQDMNPANETKSEHVDYCVLANKDITFEETLDEVKSSSGQDINPENIIIDETINESKSEQVDYCILSNDVISQVDTYVLCSTISFFNNISMSSTKLPEINLCNSSMNDTSKTERITSSYNISETQSLDRVTNDISIKNTQQYQINQSIKISENPHSECNYISVKSAENPNSNFVNNQSSKKEPHEITNFEETTLEDYVPLRKKYKIEKKPNTKIELKKKILIGFSKKGKT